MTFCIALPGIGGAIQADSLNAAASACSKGYHWQQALLFGEDRAVGMWLSGNVGMPSGIFWILLAYLRPQNRVVGLAVISWKIAH